jgi:hypothetical protein
MRFGATRCMGSMAGFSCATTSPGRVSIVRADPAHLSPGSGRGTITISGRRHHLECATCAAMCSLPGQAIARGLPDVTEDCIMGRAVSGPGHHTIPRMVAEGVETPEREAWPKARPWTRLPEVAQGRPQRAEVTQYASRFRPRAIPTFRCGFDDDMRNPANPPGCGRASGGHALRRIGGPDSTGLLHLDRVRRFLPAEFFDRAANVRSDPTMAGSPRPDTRVTFSFWGQAAFRRRRIAALRQRSSASVRGGTRTTFSDPMRRSIVGACWRQTGRREAFL